MNWAVWQPQNKDDLIGQSARVAYDNSAVQMGDAHRSRGREATLRVGFWGPPGTGKTTIARMLTELWTRDSAYQKDDLQNLKGRLVSIDTCEKIMQAGQTSSLFGDFRALVINEADKVQPAAQDVLLDWLEDELPERYMVAVTTNAQPLTQEQMDDQGIKPKRDGDYLTPKFASRFEWFNVHPPTLGEMAKGLARITGVDEDVAKYAAKAAKGDLRQAFKQVAKYKAALV